MRIPRRIILAVALAAVVSPPAALASNSSPIGCQSTGNGRQCPTVSYAASTLNDPADTTFNQLLGINQAGVIAGYFGSGAQGHPNKGYLLFPPYFQNYYGDNNFPNSVQTQATGLNNAGVLVGFWSSMNNAGQNGNPPSDDNHGWYKLHGHFFQADFPTSSPASPPVDQLLGINDRNVAVGFYVDGAGNTHGYTYSIPSHSSREVTVPNFSNITAAAINNRGDIAGFGTFKGNTDGFLLGSNGHVDQIAYPGASATMVLGLNNSDEAVGVATVGSGNNAQQHGFTWAPGLGFRTVDAPRGQGTTTLNGVNACGDIVGFYVDGAGNTDGLLLSARFSQFLSPVSGGAGDARDRAGARRKRIRTKLPKGC